MAIMTAVQYLASDDGDDNENDRIRLAVIAFEDADGKKIGVIRKRGGGTYWYHVNDDCDIFASRDATDSNLELSNIGSLDVAKITEANRSYIGDNSGENIILGELESSRTYLFPHLHFQIRVNDNRIIALSLSINSQKKIDITEL